MEEVEKASAESFLHAEAGEIGPRRIEKGPPAPGIRLEDDLLHVVHHGSVLGPALLELQLRSLAVRDVHHVAPQTHRAALGIRHHVYPVTEPHRAPVGGEHAVLGLVAAALTQSGREVRPDRLAIVGVDPARPEARLVEPAIQWKAEGFLGEAAHVDELTGGGARDPDDDVHIRHEIREAPLRLGAHGLAIPIGSTARPHQSLEQAPDSLHEPDHVTAPAGRSQVGMVVPWEPAVPGVRMVWYRRSWKSTRVR